MLLTIDVGNTQTTIGLFADDGTNKTGWRMPTLHTDTSDSLRSRLHGYFAMDSYDFGAVTDAAVASVVPVLTHAWLRCFQRMLGHDPLMVGPGASCGMPIALKNPAKVGADRIANAVAAVKRYGAPVIVVDFGTATNIDVVDQDGAYRGGTIGPGLILSAAVCAGGKTVERAQRGSSANARRLHRSGGAGRTRNWRSGPGRGFGGPHKNRARSAKRHRCGNRRSCAHRKHRDRPLRRGRPRPYAARHPRNLAMATHARAAVGMLGSFFRLAATGFWRTPPCCRTGHGYRPSAPNVVDFKTGYN